MNHKIYALLQIIHEEVTANGGNFISPDSHLWYNQSFGITESSNASLLKSLETEIKKYDPTQEN
jgi:hypothetical protein